MGKLTQEVLQRYHDGELSTRATKRVEADIEASPQWRQSLQQMSQLGELLRLMNEESLDDVSFDGFEARVTAGIEREDHPGGLERLRVWLSEVFEHRPVIWVPATAVVGVSLALLLALPFIGGGTGNQTSGPVPATGAGNNTGGGIWTASAGGAAGSSIEAVDYGGASGQVYDVPNGKGGMTAVVWINEKQ